MTDKPGRREVMIGGAAALVVACGKAPGPTGPPTIDAAAFDHASEVDFDPEAAPEDKTRFPLGVQSGAMREASALLWTYSQTAAPVTVRVWRELAEPGKVALVSETSAQPDDAGYVKLPVEGLAPATWYRFGFFSEGFSARAALGRFRTAFPADWEEPISIGASTCTNYRMMPYKAIALTAQQPIDFFVHLGDITYTDEGGQSRTIYDYRAKWKRTLKDSGYRALFSTVGHYSVWDDHEIANDLDPETFGRDDPMAFAAAKQSFFETLAVERGEKDRLWRSYRWGKTLELFVLDCRAERKPSTKDTADAEYISKAQYEWLTSALAESPCHFKVLLNSVAITGLPPIWANNFDRWQGYPAQREKLLAFLDEKALRNVWFLSGDFHLGMICRVEKEGPRRRHWEILVGPGGNNGNPLAILLESGSPQDKELAFPKKQFNWAFGGTSATTLTFDPKNDFVYVRFLDPDTGAVRFEQVLRSSES
jgi:alkaline phosphatase D